MYVVMYERKNKISKEDATEIVKRCNSIADFCREVGWVPRGGNYKIFHKYVKEYGLDTSHFSGIKSNIGNRLNSNKEKSFGEYSKNYYARSSTLLKKLIKEGLKEWKCECCGNTEWMGDKIPLELHHKDGDHYNNSFENLSLLCPNCHAKTEAYRGRKLKKKTERKCSECGSEISRWSKSGLCASCARKKQRKIEPPQKKDLLEMMETESINKIAKNFGVSYHTVNKWVKRYGIKK